MNFNENSEIKELSKKLSLIKEKGFIKSVNNNISGMGLTFENELGIIRNNFIGPDYYGIEIKTRKLFAKTPINFFSIYFNNTFEEIETVINKFGCNNISGGKNLMMIINSKSIKKLKSGYYARLQINKDTASIKLLFLDGNNIIMEETLTCNYNIIWSYFIQKLNCLVMIETIEKIINGQKYYNYINMNSFYLKTNTDFLKLIEEGSIFFKVNFGSYTFGFKKGKMHNHGCMISIYEKDLFKLFTKIK